MTLLLRLFSNIHRRIHAYEAYRAGRIYVDPITVREGYLAAQNSLDAWGHQIGRSWVNVMAGSIQGEPEAIGKLADDLDRALERKGNQ